MQIVENLVRHVGGSSYLRAKLPGKVIRVKLAAMDLKIAKLQRDGILAELRLNCLAGQNK